ncbi:beta-1,3-galactosyl-O-glycosyl-glycoprotein beta-1,6-N-acetylglucosaminyltransferase isoform X3 [Bos indicus]|uniref:Beta-1,3-galactosyl-O-glycosyl-glycoprotein beta-1,6-N-acetylglucosaminyltransferase isoform X3 n=1 Tax=Bos indicus TaxID=9915 RepID=A0ABM4SSL6_BOSIN|nr:beta-1,3-galactosyl-O-glycosyl-glycoprotein beta-1,6-N-acetylglucosaminyltransferase isoform X2 [Bos indicus x Bos taurus]
MDRRSFLHQWSEEEVSRTEGAQLLRDRRVSSKGGIETDHHPVGPSQLCFWIPSKTQAPQPATHFSSFSVDDRSPVHRGWALRAARLEWDFPTILCSLDPQLSQNSAFSHLVLSIIHLLKNSRMLYHSDSRDITPLLDAWYI